MMSKLKANFIETGILSVGLFVAGLGLQDNAKAAVNQMHSKVKYVNSKKHYTVSPRVSYFNISSPTPQSAATKGNRLSSFGANSFATNSSTQSSVAQKSHATNAKSSKSNAYQASNKSVHRAKKGTYDYSKFISNQQSSSIKTKLRLRKHPKNKYNAHVHKAVSSETGKAVQSTNVLTSTTSPSSSALSSSASKQSISYRDASDTTSTKASSASSTVSDISNPLIQSLITESKRYLGASYEYGGTGQDGSFDCSGFTQYLYQHQKINLPRTAQQQYDLYQHVDAGQAKAGDLVFFGSDNNDISHVGIYLGNGKMIDAQDQGVIIEAVNAPWWNLVGYARIIK